MSWFKIDDGFWSHPKTLRLSDGAQALWMRAGSWSMSHLTDGFIPDYALPVLKAKPRFIAELRDVSLWKPVKDGNQFHDWEKYQPTKEQVEADRLAAAERKRKSRGQSRRDTPVTDGENPPDAAPSPPDPPARPLSSTKKEGSQARGSRVPRDFKITPEMRTWATQETPLVDLNSKLPEWLDYWSAVPGDKGVKLDWVATWRNGMRKQQQFAERDLKAAPAASRKKINADDPY